MLDSMILTTRDEEIVRLLRRRAGASSNASASVSRLWEAVSVGKDLAAIGAAQVKGIADLWRSDKPVQNARDRGGGAREPRRGGGDGP